MIYGAHYNLLYPRATQTVLSNGGTSTRTTAALEHTETKYWKLLGTETNFVTNYIKHYPT